MMANKITEPKDEQGSDSSWIQAQIDKLAPDVIPPVQVARSQMERRVLKNKHNLGKKIFQPKYRTAWAALVVMVALAISLTFPQVRVIANSFLGLFRVEQIEAVDVGISLDSLPAEMEPYFAAMDSLIGDQVIVDKVMRPVDVQNLAEASQLAGFRVRMPAYPAGETHLQYQPASSMRIVIDRARWQAFIDGMGYEDFTLPESADGKQLVFHIPQMVVIGIGDCQYNEINEVKLGSPETKNCTILLQSETPTIEAPAGVDINRAGQIMLQVLGLSEMEAKAFSNTINWATTLVVPVPSDVEYRQVRVDGVDGIFLENRVSGGKTVYTLMWIKDNRLHALIGDGTLAEAQRSVNSLE